MDGDPHSPVVLQHSSSPHTLSPPSNFEIPSTIFQPLADTTTVAESRQIPPLEELPSPPTMEEPSLQVDPVEGEESRTAAAENLVAETRPAPENESLPVAPELAAAIENSTLANTNEPIESSEQPISQSTTAPEAQDDTNVVETDSNNPTTDPDPPPPPPPVIEEPKIEVPEWVLYEEDKSEMTAEELKKIEGTDADVSALDVLHHEKKIYVDVDDPEQRPVKKLRLSWTIKGVRGTKERPNYARVMNSPAAHVDGFYWHIKFFPRGNGSSHLSSYIQCTPTPPKPDSDVPESTFKVFQGPPDANLGNIEPVVEMSTPATAPKKDDSTSANSPKETELDSKKTVGEVSTDTTTASAVDPEKSEDTSATREPEKDWRISAQIGTVIYNPAEPRSGWFMRSEHQFHNNNNDWGWTNFHVPWNTLHIREKDQRKPLLQNDTLTIDAYIQIHEDPTQALWWHRSETEEQWDSKSLTGHFPFGTPPLYHSPGVAGLSSLLLLKPFRDVLQGIDTGRWRKDARAKPQPLISHLQVVLFLMRAMKKEDQYVNLNPVLDILSSYSETYSTVRQFWEVLRRSIELELEQDGEALEKLADIFDGAEVPEATPLTLTRALRIPVEGIEDMQTGIEKSLDAQEGNHTFPKFLTIDLDRQKFDTSNREWKVLHDRVKLNHEIDLSRFSTEKVPARYSLYGFAIHVGERVSGRAYSVLRPGGPGTKWLAFEDGDGNKVFSYTTKRIQDYEGLEGEALSSFRSTRQTAYLAMYIRTDCLKEFLPGTLDAYDEPSFDWIRAHLVHNNTQFIGESKPKRAEADDAAKKNISVEVYEAAKTKGRRGLLDMYNLRDRTKPFQSFCLPATTTYKELRRIIADSMWIDNVESIRFWVMDYGALGEFMIALMTRSKLEHSLAGRKNKDHKPLCLWLEVLENEEDLKLYGITDPPEPEKAKVDQTGLFGDSVGATEETSGDNSGALDLLFPESQDGSADGTPAGTVTTPSSGGTNDQADPAAPPDQVQQSVATAVSTLIDDVPRSPANMADPPSAVEFSRLENPDVLENFDFDSFLNSQPENDLINLGAGPDLAGDTTPRAAPIEHERLIDAATAEHSQGLEGIAGDEHTDAAVPEIDYDSAAIIAAVIAAEVEALDTAEEMAISSGEAAPNASSETPPEATTEATQDIGETQPVTIEQPVSATSSTLDPPSTRDEDPLRPQLRPIPHVYGFIQLFDIDQQDFVIHSTFFAPYGADVKQTVRKAMGYGDDHEICIWQRERSCNTSSVNSGSTFENIHFRDGVDLVVGEPLSEKAKEQFLAHGKFVTPDSLSRYLWMKQRRHPVEAFTGTKTLNTFGRDYYSGPLLNGRFHGDNATYITSTGHTYAGPFVSGVRQGQTASLTYQNGDLYTGSFHADEKHGQGVFVQKRTGNKYVGGYQNDKRWGKGTMYYEVADEEGEMCQICYGEEMDALFYDCGHVCACVECARQVDICPICRKSVREVVRVYRA